MGTSSTEISKYCRLCACETDAGFTIFDDSDDKASLDILINKYLPIKVFNDGKLPGQICQLCQNGVAATVDLIDRMVEGQQRLRMIIQNDLLSITENSIDASTLIDIQGHTPDILMDDLVKGCDIQKVYDDSHIMSLAVAGPITPVKKKRGRTKKIVNEPFPVFEPPSLLDMAGTSSDMPLDDLGKVDNMDDVFNASGLLDLQPTEELPVKRKRGRPRKTQKSNLSKSLSSPTLVEDSSNNNLRRPKRKINPPTRFRDTVEGDEFEDKVISLKEEPVLGGFDEDLFDENLIASVSQDIGTFNSSSSNSIEFNEDGTSIILATDNTNQQSKLPAAVNIEVDFKEEPNDCIEGIADPLGFTSFTIPMPTVSLVKVEENAVPRQKTKISRNMFTKRRGAKKKAKWICEFCGKGFLHKGRYALHMKLHKSVLLQCNECKDKFATREDLKIHQSVSAHSGIGIIERTDPNDKEEFKCPHCPNERTFFTQDGYNNHVASKHEGQKPFSCNRCGKRFTYRHSLRNHTALHDPIKEERKYSCDICGKVFQHPSSLVYHKESRHNNGRMYVCVICGTSFKHKQLLQRHFTVHSDKRPFKCNICHMAFKTRGNLYNHDNIHTRAKKYTCELCGKQFNHLTSLTLHIRAHKGEKPYKCQYCAKKFSQNGNLQEHVRIHTGDKPYSCQTCGKKFTTSSQHKLHLLKHKEQPYSCRICSKTFTNKEIWYSHENKHKGERPFTCIVCQKSYVDLGTLKRHLKMHEGQKSYPCCFCGKEFPDIETLAKHKILHKENDVLNKNKLPQGESSWFLASRKSKEDEQVIYIFSKIENEENDPLEELKSNPQDEQILEPLNTNVPKIIEIPVVPKDFQTFTLEDYNEGQNTAATMVMSNDQGEVSQHGSHQIQMLTHDTGEAMIPVLSSDGMPSGFFI